MKNGIMQTETGPASVAIFALPSRHAAIPGSAARPGS
jgi:hypothetical protein